MSILHFHYFVLCFLMISCNNYYPLHSREVAHTSHVSLREFIDRTPVAS